MKTTVTYSIILLLFACTTKTDQSPTETSRIVLESFFKKDTATLKQHTTKEGYEGLLSIQNFIGTGKTGDSNFKVLDEKVDGDTAWVKFTSAYEKKPGSFKLLKQNGEWKVTRKKLKEKGPF